VIDAGALGIPRLGGGPADELATLAQRLLDAESPMVIVDRIGNVPAAVEALDRICREFAFAARPSRHRMNLRDDHPSRYASWKLAEADAVLVLEAQIPWIPAQEEPPPGAWVAVAGTDPAALEIPLYEFRAHQRITADPAEFLLQLEEEMRSRRKPHHAHAAEQRWARIESDMQAALRAEEAALKRDLESSTVTERVLSSAVGEVLEPDDILTWELAPTEHCPRTRPMTLFDSGGSSLGWGVAAAAGALLVDRGRTAVCMTGDGSYSFGSPDALLWTQQYHDVPVMTVVCNNRGYRTGTVKLVRDYPEGYSATHGDLTGGTFDPPPDFSAHATAAGGVGRKVLTRSELVDALREARRAVSEDRVPAVVDVWLDSHVTGEHPLKE
jgi:acetolactate synthase-1/2/3 large subunit